MITRLYISGILLTVVLALAPDAMAQQQGTTSGSAAGSAVEPSTAIQKQNSANPPESVGEQAKEGAIAAGAPGVTAQPGTQGGPPPLTPKPSAAGEQAKEAAPAAGAPGVTAQPGTQGGPPPPSKSQ
jgi:hypothetical protein